MKLKRMPLPLVNQVAGCNKLLSGGASRDGALPEVCPPRAIKQSVLSPTRRSSPAFHPRKTREESGGRGERRHGARRCGGGAGRAGASPPAGAGLAWSEAGERCTSYLPPLFSSMCSGGFVGIFACAS
jgi:hypothetical protein